MKTFTKIRKMLIVILLSVFAFTQTQALCDYEIALYDDWGDGWNGGTVSVYVDGTVVLNNITLATGSGPEYYTFQVTTGAEITTVYTPGDWSYENEYHIIDAIGTVVRIDGGGGTTPTGIGPGLLYGNCPSLPGAFEGYVTNGQGLSIGGADVYVELVPAWSAVTNPTGYYIISDVQPAIWDVVASRVGYWNDTASVTVISNDTVQQDFILTRPQVTITPLLFNMVLHPNQYFTDWLSILNTGDGLLLWNAVIVYPPTDGEPEPIHVPAFTGEVEKVRHPNSTGLAPKELAKQSKPGEIYHTDNFRGSVAFGYQAVGTDEFVNFDIDDVGAYTVVANATTPNFVAGVAYPIGEEDFVYGVVYGSSNLYEIDVATGAWTDLGSMGILGFNDMTIDPTSGTYYAASSDNLYIINANGPSATLVGAFTNSNVMIGITCDGDGNLWGYDIGNDNFYSIDKNTGLATVVGSLGFNASYAQCAFYDPETEQVLLGAFNAGNYYCEIRVVDVTTGASVILSSVYYKEMTAAAIPVGTGEWLSLSSYSGIVPPNGGTENIGVIFNAEGFVAGDYVTAEIIFTTYPDVGTITVPVSMTVLGFPFNMPYNLVVTLINEITGEVYLTWDFDGDAFQYFIVKRNGVFLGSATGQCYTDFLPDYDEYCYTVIAVYDEGQSAPAGPECIEWSNPTMVINPMSLYAAVWPNHTVMVSTNISNTGIGSLSYAFPDFVPGDGLFITSVLPSSGILVPGESVNINITYDATGFDLGLYSEWLYIESNDPNRLYDSIFNEMFVYQPAQITGTVTNGNTGAPIGGVEVTVGIWQTMTAPDGTYSLYVDPGYYDMAFEKAGFQTVIVLVHAVIVTQLDVQMFEEAYPPGWVYAEVNDDDTECLVEWSVPMGPYEIIYDDGSADDYFVWSTMGNANAVKFTPAGYPATVIGGKIYVGDGSFPVGANFLGTTFGVVVYDDDGVGGLPGTQLDSIGVYVDNYGWVDFSGLYVTIDDGDFFIAMFQGGIPPNTAPVGIDYTIPTVYRSYSYDAGFNVWVLSAYQDFMIRAIVSGPQSDDGMTESTEIVYPTKPVKHNFLSLHAPKGIPGIVKSGEYRPVTDGVDTNRDVVSYTVVRFSNFDPNCSPLAGDTTVLATGLTGLIY